MDELQKFYKNRQGECQEMCKACQTMHIDNFDESTFLWLLEKLDFPYIPEKWSSIRTREYEKDPKKFNGMSVIGKYVGSMRLSQHKGLGWADTEKIAQEQEQKIEKAKADNAEYIKKLDEDLAEGKISEAQYKTLMPVEEKNDRAMSAPIIAPIGENNFFNEKDFIAADELPDPTAELTKEDKLALAMKWGRTYKVSECLTLELDYKRMKDSFDIQDADSENTLQLLCKTHLKMDQAIDIGDIDTYLKLSKVYESMRKSAKFTAAQNKETKNDFVDSVGELVTLCEKHGHFIPRYVTDVPQDKVDLTLKDMEQFYTNLVTKDLGFGQQLEIAIQKIENQLRAEAEEREAIARGDIEDPSLALENEDYVEEYDRIAAEIEADANYFAEASEGDE